MPAFALDHIRACHLWSTVRVKTSRRLRSLVALAALFGVLFSQLALSAYACDRSHGAPAAHQFQGRMDMPDCDQPMPDGRSALCHAHCEQGDNSIDRPAAPELAPVMPGHEAPVSLAAPLAAHVAGERTQASLLEHTRGPPIAVLFARFLI